MLPQMRQIHKFVVLPQSAQYTRSLWEEVEEKGTGRAIREVLEAIGWEESKV